jgi:MFS family permease
LRAFNSLDRALISADFVKLWTASAVSNIGDGVTMVAGPLLVAALTTDPAAVAVAVFAQQLPWLLFALISGGWGDRLDRRRLVVVVNLARAAALGLLVAVVASGMVTVWLVYATFFLLGTGETLADTASSAFVPAIVPTDRLPAANAWLGATFTVANQFAAKPLGAWLFVVAAALPFGVNAVSFAVSAVLVAGIRSIPRPAVIPDGGRAAAARTESQPRDPGELVLPPAAGLVLPPPAVGPVSPPAVGPVSPPPAGVGGAARRSLRVDIADGIRWLWNHRLLRTLAVTMAFGNLAFCAAFAIFVLYSRQRLGLSDVGYGVLLTAFAVGGLLGAILAPRLLARIPATALLRAGLLVEVALHGTLAATTRPVVAAAIIVVFGVHTVVWGVVVTTVRQRAVPPAMYGRVSSVYSLLDLGGAALGSLTGGAVAQAYGLVATFWTAAAAMAVIAVVAWRPLSAASNSLTPTSR